MALLPAIPIYLFNRRFFAKDFDAIRAFGAARTPEEMTSVGAEFATVNRLERSIRRGFLSIRISGTRLLSLYERLLPYVREPQTEPEATFVPKEAAIDKVVSVRAEAGRIEASAAALRKLRQAHAEITAGRAVDQVIAGLGYTEDDFLETLEQNGAGNPDFGWLHEYVIRERRLREVESENERLESENARLHRKVTSQATEIDALKEQLDRVANH
jgi:hypothetical protein